MLVRLCISERFSELSVREPLPCSHAQGLRCHRYSKSEALGTRETAVFYLADPTDVGFLDVFFPTAGSREASFSGAWMASQSEDVSTRG